LADAAVATSRVDVRCCPSRLRNRLLGIRRGGLHGDIGVALKVAAGERGSDREGVVLPEHPAESWEAQVYNAMRVNTPNLDAKILAVSAP
jgi:hypothetical protein